MTPVFECPKGLSVPKLGLGTFQPEAAPAQTVVQTVLKALRTGYRHIDTAFMYGDGNVERAVGQALKEWGGPREEAYIVSKLANAHHRPEDVAHALNLSLKNLGLTYIDLYLTHYPVAYERDGDKPEDWRTARLPNGQPKVDYELSNRLRELLKTATMKPAVLQLEMHPYLPQFEIMELCRTEGIHVTAHSPLGGRPVPQVALNKDVPGPLHDTTIQAIAKKHGRTAADILLKWGIQRGTSVIPKSYDPAHIQSNYAVLSHPNLPDEDMRAIDNLRKPNSYVRFMDPRRHWGFDIFDEAQAALPERKDDFEL